MTERLPLRPRLNRGKKSPASTSSLIVIVRSGGLVDLSLISVTLVTAEPRALMLPPHWLSAVTGVAKCEEGKRTVCPHPPRNAVIDNKIKYFISEA